MQHTKTNWSNKPSTNTPISAENLNNIENTLYELTREDTATIEGEYPWLGNITLKRKGNRVEMSAELTTGDPWNSDHAILFTVPEGFRPKVFTILSAYTNGATIPMQYYEVDDLRVFYLNTKFVTKPAISSDIVFNTFYFLD